MRAIGKRYCAFLLMVVMAFMPTMSSLAMTGEAQDAVQENMAMVAADNENRVESTGGEETASQSDASAERSGEKNLTEETAVSDSIELINDLPSQAEEDIDYELASGSDAILINDLTVLTQTTALTVLEEVEKPDPPVISSIINTTSGLKITWEDVDDAERYYVYRKSADENSYTRIGATSHTYYTDTDVTDGVTYSYRIRTRSESAISSNSDTISYKRLERTTITKLTNTSTALELTWDETDGAKKYYIYRKASGESKYTQIRATAKNTYADTDVKNGVTYSYQVVVNNGSYVSANSAAKSCKRLKRPTISGVTSTSSGLKISWNSVSNAQKYYVYRKADGESSYTRIKATTHTYYTDTDVESGVIYTYRIKTNNGSYTSAYSDAKKYEWLSRTTISKISNTSTALKLTWDAVDGAKRYHIYRKASGESSYTKVRVTAKTSWSDTDVANGTTYSYRIYTISGSYSGAASATKSYKRLTRPTISSLTGNGLQSMTIKWNKNSKVTGYQIQYSQDSGFSSYDSTKASVKKVSKTVSDLKKTGLYYFRIRSYYTTSGTNYYSAWSAVKSRGVVEGTSGNSGENYENLFDHDLSTKWCVTKFTSAYVIWKESSAVSVLGYYIGTGNDNTKYNGRNPKSWTLYGCNSTDAPARNSSNWVVISEETDDEYLEDVNQKLFQYTFADAAPAYNYYKLEVNEVQSGSCLQLSEFALIYDGCDHEFDNIGSDDSSSTSSSSSSIPSYDGGTYSLKVGETLNLTNPAYRSDATYYVYSWDISEGTDIISETSSGGRTTTIKALKVGTATVVGTYYSSYPVIKYGSKYNITTKRWESYSYTTYSSANMEYVFTINVTK